MLFLDLNVIAHYYKFRITGGGLSRFISFPGARYLTFNEKDKVHFDPDSLEIYLILDEKFMWISPAWEDLFNQLYEYNYELPWDDLITTQQLKEKLKS